MSTEPLTAALSHPGAPPRPPAVERFALLVGLFFCAAALGFVALELVSLSTVASEPAEYLAGATQRARWVDLLLFPLGFATSIAVLVAAFRSWNLRARRSRLRLATFGLMFAMILLELALVDPLAERLLAATDVTASSFAADAAQLARWAWVRAAFMFAIAGTLVVAHRSPMPAAVAVSASGLTARHRTLLLLVGTATFFEGYDRFIASLALPYIGKDLGANEGALGYALAFIRLGALVSIVLGRLADRHGRRRLLIVSVTAYTVATAATGFSYGLLDFALYQLVAAIFLATELTLAQVVIAEEFPPAARGMGQGLLGAFAALGSGLAAMLFPMMQRTEFGWRAMYLIGILPLLVVAFLRRNLPETQRFEQQSRRALDEVGFRDLARDGRRANLAILTLLSAVAAATAAPAFSFASYRATTAFNWSPGQVSTMIIGAGSAGLFGYFLMGRLTDLVGRRWIGCAGIVAGGFAVMGFYQSQWLLSSFALLTFAESGVIIAVNSLATELFPTRLRATAKAWVTNSATVGGLVGLGAVGAFSNVSGDYGAIISGIAVAMMLLAPTILFLPETRRMELEEIESPTQPHP